MSSRVLFTTTTVFGGYLTEIDFFLHVNSHLSESCRYNGLLYVYNKEDTVFCFIHQLWPSFFIQYYGDLFSVFQHILTPCLFYFVHIDETLSVLCIHCWWLMLFQKWLVFWYFIQFQITQAVKSRMKFWHYSTLENCYLIVEKFPMPFLAWCQCER